MQKNQWHALTVAEVLRQRESSFKGLSENEAVRRLGSYGRNVLPQDGKRSRLDILLEQFTSPLMYILFAAVVGSFLLGHISDAVFIIVVVVMNALVGFYQESKVNDSLAALKQMVRVRSQVLRDGNYREIDSEELVPGDVVFLKSGEKVPADCYLLEASNLLVNENSLTGESLPVAKEVTLSRVDAPVSDRVNMVFMGTVVDDGRATAVVVATGEETEFGQIYEMLENNEEIRTPLQKQIVRLSRLLGSSIVVIIGLIVVIGVARGLTVTEMVSASLALAVSAIPEGLLPAITVVLVLGMRRILAKQGLVRKLVANETLGSVTVICTDKTGTLTEGTMRVSHILTTSRELLHQHLETVRQDPMSDHNSSHIRALRIMALVNDAYVENETANVDDWLVRGKLMERGLLMASARAGFSKKELERQYPLVDKLSFNSERGYAASLHEHAHQKKFLYVVGAPEKILEHITTADQNGVSVRLDSQEYKALKDRYEQLVRDGLVVLACAYREYPLDFDYGSLDELVQKLTLVSFVGIRDPLRADVRDAMEKTKKAGIRTIIVTGDHRMTAEAVAGELGFVLKTGEVFEGVELDRFSDEEFLTHLQRAKIFARVSPRHKLRIVKALQAHGEVVAMLGDGVNDAPALQAADIGVAVGSGTDVAKEVADIVLLDNGFVTVVKAVEQGRIIFQNIRKVFVYMVSDSFSEIFLFLASMLVGLPLPLLPVQILWVNLMEDGFPGMALTTEQEIAGVMDRPPRDPHEPIVHRPLKFWLLVIFLVNSAAAFGTYVFVLHATGNLVLARTVVFAVTTFDTLLFAFSARSFNQSAFRTTIFKNRYLVMAAGFGLLLMFVAIYLPVVRGFLSFESLHFSWWLYIVVVSFIELVIIDGFKMVLLRKKA